MLAHSKVWSNSATLSIYLIHMLMIQMWKQQNIDRWPFQCEISDNVQPSPECKIRMNLQFFSEESEVNREKRY